MRIVHIFLMKCLENKFDVPIYVDKVDENSTQNITVVYPSGRGVWVEIVCLVVIAEVCNQKCRGNINT